MAKKLPQFEYANCVACGVCVQDCPVSCLAMSLIGIDKWKKRYPTMAEEGCIGCGICAKDCPTNTIEMRGEQ